MQKAKEAVKIAVQQKLEQEYKEALEKGEVRLVVAYNEGREDALQYESELKTIFPNIPFLSCDGMSLSIACHTGPDALAFGIIRVIPD